eukprot:UN08086
MVLYLTRVLLIDPSTALRLAFIACDLGIFYNELTAKSVSLSHNTPAIASSSTFGGGSSSGSGGLLGISSSTSGNSSSSGNNDIAYFYYYWKSSY